MRFYTENVQHDYCTHKEFPSLFLHARHLLPAADHGKECGSDRYYATASTCIISYSVEPRQFNANTAFFHFYEHFHPLTPKQAHLSVCLFSVYYSLSCDPLSPTTESADQILYLPHDDEPADKRCCPLESPPEQRQEQPEQKQMIPRLLIRQLLPLYRQHHRPVQTRRRFPRPSPPAHGISR